MPAPAVLTRARWVAAAALAALGAGAPLAAQRVAPESRMEALIEAVGSDSRERVAAFFPRAGSWMWSGTTRERNSATVVRMEAWRFPAAETLRAISEGGPVCGTFDTLTGHSGPFEEKLGMRMRRHPREWRRVGERRFVPPGSSDRSHTFVEWRWEGDRWVISSVGDRDVDYPRRMLGRRAVQPWEIRRTTAPPERELYAAEAEWYSRNVPIVLDGTRYITYGKPREVAPGSLSRIGVKDGVPVYAARGEERAPDVIYVPTGPSLFQAYEGRLPQPCR